MILSNKKYQKELKAKRIAAGLCQTCGKEPFRPGSHTGEACLEQQRLRARAARKKTYPLFKALGICPCCRQREVMREIGKVYSYCGVCAEQQSERKERRKLEKKRLEADLQRDGRTGRILS